MAHRGRKNADEALALAVASGQTLRDAAAAARIGERTAARRWADPEFRRHVAELRADMVSRALGKLADNSTAAVDALRGLLTAGGDGAKLGAARAILELGNKLRESVELEQRLADLERRIADEDNT